MAVSDCNNNNNTDFYQSVITEGDIFEHRDMTDSRYFAKAAVLECHSSVCSLPVEESGSSELCSPVECITDCQAGNDKRCPCVLHLLLLY